jgi:putative hydroxymethylpyrimidine transporter CytX
MPPEWGTEPVPEEARTLRGFDYLVLWFSLAVGLLVMAAGAILTMDPAQFGLGLSLGEAFLVIVLGSAVGSLMLAAAGLIGSRYGVPSMVSLRPVLGRYGSYLPTTMNVLQLIGWTSFEVMIMGEAAAAMLGGTQGSALNLALVLLFGLFCGLLAIGGPLVVVRQWLKKFGIWLVLISTAWLTYALLTSPTDYMPAVITPSPLTSLLLGLDLVIAMPISWWPLLSDYNRFARNGWAAAGGTALGYTLANTWFFFLGAAMVVLLGQSSPIEAILALGFGGLALLMLLVDETDNAFADIYSSAVSTQNLRPRLPQRWLVVFFTGLGIGLAVVLTLAGGLSAALNYEFFLLLIGGFFVPLLGVLASDWFLVRRGRYDVAEFGAESSRLRWPPLVAWAAGVAVYFAVNGILFLGLDPVLPAIGGSLPAFILAAALHAALSIAAGSRAAAETPR